MRVKSSLISKEILVEGSIRRYGSWFHPNFLLLAGVSSSTTTSEVRVPICIVHMFKRTIYTPYIFNVYIPLALAVRFVDAWVSQMQDKNLKFRIRDGMSTC
jgi:hypothetical protein